MSIPQVKKIADRWAEAGIRLVAIDDAWKPWLKEQPQAQPAGDVLSVPEAARELKTSEDTIRGWVNSRQLKASNVATGRRPRYLIKREDLDAFLRSRQKEPLPRRTRKV